MKTKKIIGVLMAIVLTMFVFAGCESTTAYTFNVETGEQIKIQLNTSSGMKLSQSNGQFIIKSENDETISTGTFFLPETFNELYNNIDVLDGVEVITTNKNSDPNYVFYKFVGENSTEWNYLIKPSDSIAGIVIGNIVSEESAKEVFDLLTFEVNPD